MQSWEDYFFRANEHYRAARYAEALDDYVKALELNTHSWEIRNNLGLLLAKLGQSALALQMWQEALELEPHACAVLNNLANLYRKQHAWADAQRCLTQALAIKPADPELLTNLALLYKAQGQLDRALQCYHCVSHHPHPPVEFAFNYAIALIQQGDWLAGFRWYEQRWQQPRLRALQHRYDQHCLAWQGQSLAAKTLLIWQEQGLGDMVQMARFLPLWQERHPYCRLILRVAPPLARLLASCFAIEVQTNEEPWPRADFHLSAMSLPFYLQCQASHVVGVAGYLRAEHTLIKRWAHSLGQRGVRPRVGLVWQSGKSAQLEEEYDWQTRSLTRKALTQLLACCQVEWINLQVGGEPMPVECTLGSLPIENFADTAAILSQLDALVSVDTAAAHVAGALACPTWVLLPVSGGNLYPASGAVMPWYRSMTLLRQTRCDDWSAPITQLLQQIKN